MKPARSNALLIILQSISALVFICATPLYAAMGIAGIPAASLVGIAIILAAVGLPTEAIGVLLVFDRILDMARTAINVLADACCAVIVARLEGETAVLADAAETARASA